ncbi:peptidoglycan DD-metalloendopeptidase family protein [Streptomyces sp. NPDC007063]|uniref:M23 family metallopeptidase n=1 Tax=Streptomyces sp. NPDC007063 TaxID=3364772 RepID=UPI0036D1E16D
MVNDRHPSGVPNPDDPGSGFSYGTYGVDHGQSAYGAYPQESYQAGPHDAYAAGTYAPPGDPYPGGSYPSYGEDPLFGALPGSDTGSAATASWDATTAWGTGSYQPDAMAGPDGSADAPAVPGFGQGHPVPGDGTGQWTIGVQETGNWDTTSWGTGGWEAAAPQPGDWATDGQGTAFGHEGQPGYDGQPGYEDRSGYDGSPGYDGATYEGIPYEGTAYDGAAYGGFEHSAYDAPPAYDAQAAFSGYDQRQDDQGGYGVPGGHPAQDGYHLAGYEDDAFGGAETGYGNGTAQFGFDPGYAPSGQHPSEQSLEQEQEATAQWNFSVLAQDEHAADEHTQADAFGHEPPHEHGFDFAEPDLLVESASEDIRESHPDTSAGVGGSGGSHGRGRRRSPKPRRRALMTVAVPSVAVMGVAGAAAASVMGDDGKDKDSTTVAAPDASPVKPSNVNSKLDTQLQGLSADADDFADRASRTQERIDLKQRQEAEKERKAKEAARKEALRPKFVIPVKDHTLSARYGQAGVNWMSIHTGIDFPVSYGTPVMAATDGTVSTKHSVAYGNMAIVTAKDGTQTWYCHLSSNKLRSGSVKAGDVIAYSGNSGNSTGPHLHFEVRPGGGSAVDPIPWLQSKGLSIS